MLRCVLRGARWCGLVEEDRVEDVERDAEERKEKQRAAAALAGVVHRLSDLAEFVRDARRDGPLKAAQRAGRRRHRLDVLLEAVLAGWALKVHRRGILPKNFRAKLRLADQYRANRGLSTV